MNSMAKLVLLSAAAGLSLTLMSLLIVRPATVTNANNPCNYTQQTLTEKGYPLAYLTPNLPSSSAGSNICDMIGDASGSDYIAQHTPGHQKIFDLIQNNDIDVSSLAQDFLIMFLIALYPVSLFVNKRTGSRGL